MPERSKRLRIMAGPNGSGKSTILKEFNDSIIILSEYNNQNDIIDKCFVPAQKGCEGMSEKAI